MLATLKPITDNLLSQPFPPVKFNVSLGITTLHYTYPVTLKSASFDLKPGKIVLTIKGHASHSNHTIGGPFDFTATLDFSLQAVGPSVKLIPGDISLDTTSLLEELVSLFTDAATKSIANAQRSGAERQRGIRVGRRHVRHEPAPRAFPELAVEGPQQQ